MKLDIVLFVLVSFMFIAICCLSYEKYSLTNQLNETRQVMLGYVADRDSLQSKLLSCYENQHNNIKDTIIVSYRK